MIDSKVSELISPQSMLSMMKETLYQINPQHIREEQVFSQGISLLRTRLNGKQAELLDAALAEDEQELAESIFYLFWKGVKANYECFQNPVNRYFLKMDYEDFHQEDLMRSFLPKNHDDYGRKFAMSVPEEYKELTDPIYAYHAYMETFAYKLAHYFGFCYGETFLLNVVPGYHPNSVLTISYRFMISKDLSIPIENL